MPKNSSFQTQLRLEEGLRSQCTNKNQFENLKKQAKRNGLSPQDIDKGCASGTSQKSGHLLYALSEYKGAWKTLSSAELANAAKNTFCDNTVQVLLNLPLGRANLKTASAQPGLPRKYL